MYTRSRGANQSQTPNTSFVRGPILNPANNAGYQTGTAPNFSQATTPQKQVQGQVQGQLQTPVQGQVQGQIQSVQPRVGTPQQQVQQVQQQQQQQQQMMMNQSQGLQQTQQTPQSPFGNQIQKTQQVQGLFGQQTPEKKAPAPISTQSSNDSQQIAIPGLGAQGQDNPMDYEDVMPDGDGFSETSDQPRWKRSKIQGTKVNRKLRRLRMNQRLRKTLMPKNAIMVLNEMKAGVQFTFPEAQSVPNSLFLVHAELDGKTYVGQGLSKPLARQNAAENALKCLLLEKMTAAANKARTDAESDPQGCGEQTENQKDDAVAAAVAAAVGEIPNPDGSTTPTPMNTDDPDDIPWSSLASFALYKLFLEWQNQGTVVPIPRPGTQTPPKVKNEPKTPVEKTLPENALSVHPVMLLNQMKPGITYVEVSRSGNPPNTLFTLSVEIDNKIYTGAAKNKRDAKKIAAKSALRALYNLEYPEEVKIEPIMQTMPVMPMMPMEPMQINDQMGQQLIQPQ